ncbi:MAG: hypothetical protein IJL02_10105 [Methanobrevibacter sp.]|uniref:hypothetical protein n=1 Tax=Methanobrevibacter sp. TaxID=66852 RepID=UPI0025DCF08E|nr:hypothetical protein [Methanobrevibacter sp.]MBQ6100195.1 hypothetical protein [Methanobrevibacter sp.]
MTTTIRINEDVKQLLKLKSAETGITQLDLANKYILKGLKEDDTPTNIMSISDIEAMLSFDKPEGDENLEKLDGASHSDLPTNSVELKKIVTGKYDIFR